MTEKVQEVQLNPEYAVLAQKYRKLLENYLKLAQKHERLLREINNLKAMADTSLPEKAN